MKKYLPKVILTLVEDIFLIYFLGIMTGATIYLVVSWLGIGYKSWKIIVSPVIAVLGVSIFQRGVLSTLNGKWPKFTVYCLVIIIPVMFILGYWPIGSLLMGFLGGYTRSEKCEEDDNRQFF